MEKIYKHVNYNHTHKTKILQHNTPHELNEDVQRHLKEGWQRRNNMIARRILQSRRKPKEEQYDHFAIPSYEQLLVKDQ